MDREIATDQSEPGRADAAGSPTRLTQAVQNALDVLGAFTPEAPSWGVNELARHLGLHKSTVSRLLATLEERRMVKQDPQTERYRLGIGLIELAGVLLDDLDLRRVAAPYLRELSAQTRETINLAIWDGPDVVLVEHLPSPEPVKYLGWVGHREPLHATSPGKAMLAFADEATVGQVLANGLSRYTASTLIDEAALRRELAGIRARGYAVNAGEFREALNGVAAPIWRFPRELAGAVAVAGPAFRLDAERLDRFGLLVRRVAAEISRQLGTSPRDLPLTTQAAAPDVAGSAASAGGDGSLGAS